MLMYEHDLEPQSVWMLVRSNQIPWGTIPKNSIPYVQELGEFHAKAGFYTRRENLASYLLKYTVSGGGILEYRGKSYRLSAGDCFWVDCQEYQYYYTDPEIGNWHTIWVHFSGEPCRVYYEQFWEHNQSPVVRLPEHGEVQNQVSAMLKTYEQKRIDPTLDLRMSGILTDMMIQCILPSIHQDLRPMPRLIQDAQLYLASHYAEANTLDMLSKKYNISKHYFIRQFKEYTGMTPHEFLISTRIHEAKKLLRSTDLTVNEIAMKVGIEHIGHFINLFKRSEGMTPGAYHKYWNG